MIFQVNNLMRKLAKTNNYQTLYFQAKERHFKLFENDINLTDLQIKFLDYLAFYSGLYLDYAMGEIDDVVFTDEIYEDAYSYYKQHERSEKKTELQQERVSSKPNLNKNSTQKISQWVFKAPPKE